MTVYKIMIKDSAKKIYARKNKPVFLALKNIEQQAFT